MTHTALARKYRPTRFGDLAEQDHVAAGLRGAVATSRVAHAYLLTGPRGVGKTSAARILAMALNCERRQPDGEPCGACDSCRRIWSGTANLDVVEIDAASNRGVDDARELRERAMYAASGPERYKVYIIDEAHMLTREAWNALLKILEEPPPRVVFVFATTEPQKIANTAAPVLSRVQRYDFRRLGPAAIAERLRVVAEAEGVTIDDDALVLIARVAAGGMRDALSLLDQALAFDEGPVSAARVRGALGLIGEDVYGELLGIIADRKMAEVFPFVARLVDAGADLAELVNGIGETLRALAQRALGGTPDGLTEGLRTTLDTYASRFSPGDLVRMLHLLQDAEAAIRRSPNARLHVETLLLQWTLLDRTVELKDVLEALGRPAEAPRARSAPPQPPAPVSPAPSRAPTRPASGPLTLESIKDAWSAIATAVGRKRRILQEALTHASPAGVDGETVTLVVATEGEGGGAVHLDGLARGHAVLEDAFQHVLGRLVRIKVVEATRPDDPGEPTTPKRLDQQTERDQRLRAYRQKDQALDAVADALDLELLE